MFTCAYFNVTECKVQCLKYCGFVGITSLLELAAGILSVCPSVLLALTSFCPYPHCDEWVIKSTAYAALLMNYWTVESGRDGVLHAVHTEEQLCERMTDVKKREGVFTGFLCQCSCCICSLSKTFSNVLWMHFCCRSTLQIILFFLQLFWNRSLENDHIPDSYHWNRCLVISHVSVTAKESDHSLQKSIRQLPTV